MTAKEVGALYRRYRPESFQEIIGQGQVTEPLGRALESGRINHAYLFSGPRGCGKTTSARVLARCLNCAEGPTMNPCGRCDSCVELARGGGGSLDVVEIDAASHNGVDDARELRERAVFAPARDRFKIYILDEAHMVTHQGFNALLKIVEEPPPHVKFIFATTEPEKVIPTIRSRTHHYPFRLVPPAEVLTYLAEVIKSEHVNAEDGVLSLVVRAGGGSIRDSLSLLDQLIAGSSGETIGLDDAQNLLGVTPRNLLEKVIEALANADARSVFHRVNEVLTSGQDPRRFAEDLLAHIRDVVVLQAVDQDFEGLFSGESVADVASLKTQVTLFTPHDLSQFAEIVSRALRNMSGVTSPRLQLELMFAELLGRPKPSSTRGDLPTDMAPEKVPEPENPSTAQLRESAGPLGARNPEPQENEASSVDTDSLTSPQKWNLEALLAVWPSVIEDLSQHKRSLWVALSGTVPLALEGDVLSIGFPRLSDAEILKKPQGPGSPLPNADILRDLIEKHTGRRVKFTLGKREFSSQRTATDFVNESNSWPEVAKANTRNSVHSIDTNPQPDIETNQSIEKPRAKDGEDESGPIATRGEPVVRQLLGGELVAEEILDSMSDQGEGDV